MKKKRHRFLIHALSLTLTAALLQPVTVAATAEGQEAAAQTESQDAAQSDLWPAAPEIVSPSAYLLEDTTGAVLFDQAGDEVRYPGSAVKIMTMLVALENSSLSDTVTFTQTGVAAASGGAVNIAAQVGEELTMEQCLYAIMLASANDVCVQVAEHVSGSVEAFVEQMNQKAAELGCTNTVFANPTGLHDENQHSTAHDLALIMQAAIENETFRTISSAVSYTIPATNMTASPRNLTDSFPLSAQNSTSLYEGILAGKTGYTQASGSTLVTAAERNGTLLIAVVLMGTTAQTPTDAMNLLDYGFQNFQRVQYSDADATLSGGYAMLPTGVTLNQIQVTENQTEEGVSQEYYYQDHLVGRGVIQAQAQEASPTPTAIDNAEYLQTLNQEKSPVPYFIIGGAGAVILLLLALLLVKVIRS